MRTIQYFRKMPLFCAMLLLAACGGGGGGADAGADSDNPLAPIGELQFEVGCDWRETFRDGSQYFSLADDAARYWYAVGPTEPAAGTRLRIEGRYPDARYFSLHVYDGYLIARDSRADFRLNPALGSFNPFSSETRKSSLIAPGGAWTGYLEYAERPALARNNTLYRGQRDNESDPVQRHSYLMYRSYLPADAEPELPTLTLESADGSETALADTPESSTCSELAGQLSAYQRGDSEDFDPGTEPAAHDPPRFEIYYPLSNELPPLLYNIHVRYMSAALDRNLGDLVLMRGRAPSHTDQDAAPTTPDVRFWSICANRFENQLVDGCTSDRETPLDADGYYNVVISPESLRPARATVPNGYAWLPLNGAPELLIYRMMLSADAFSESIDQVEEGTDPAETMGEYFPRTTYCDRDTFEANATLTPEALFAVCAADGH